MPRLHPIRLDLANELSIEEAFASTLAEASHLDVLINNAGAGHFGPAELLPLETITSQFQILVFGQIQLLQLALQHMRPRGKGLIINVTSLASRLPVPFMGEGAILPMRYFLRPVCPSTSRAKNCRMMLRQRR